MLFRKIVPTTLAAAALLITTQAQTRPARKAPARPAAAAAKRPAATAPSAVNLTAADMALVVEGADFDARMRERLVSSADERKAFAQDVRRMLAAAEEARAAGYLARPEIKLRADLARSFVIAQTYFRQRQEAGASGPEQVVTEAEIDAFFNEPATPPQFDLFLQDYSKNSQLQGAPVPEETRKALRQHYGRVMVAMRKGTAAGLDRERKTQLSVLLQQAKLLAGVYDDETKARFQPTAAEIDAYVSAHPELDTKAERAKLEGVLARVRAGEDFVKLADEFTEDPSGKGRGGDLGWFGRGMMVKPFEDAAFGLKPGEVSGVFETVFGYHIVKLDERRGEGTGEQVHARHILIQYSKATRSPGGQRVSPRERAAGAVEEEKRNRALDEAATRRRIQVAETFAVGDAAAATPKPAAAGEAPATKTPAANSKTPASRRTPARRTPARRKP